MQKEEKQKFLNKISEIEELNQKFYKIYLEFHEYLNNISKTITEIEDDLPRLQKEQYPQLIKNIFEMIKSIFVAIDTIYLDSLTNRDVVNKINLSVIMLFDSLEKLENKDWITFKKQLNKMKKTHGTIYKKMEKIEEDATEFRKFKKIVDDLEKSQMKRKTKTKKYHGPEYA